MLSTSNVRFPMIYNNLKSALNSMISVHLKNIACLISLQCYCCQACSHYLSSQFCRSFFNLQKSYLSNRIFFFLRDFILIKLYYLKFEYPIEYLLKSYQQFKSEQKIIYYHFPLRQLESYFSYCCLAFLWFFVVDVLFSFWLQCSNHLFQVRYIG